MIAHQVKVTAHTFKLLLRQHHSMETHLRTMHREARNKAKERSQPETPRKGHRRTVQAANKAIREKLYSSKVARQLNAPSQRNITAPSKLYGNNTTRQPIAT